MTRYFFIFFFTFYNHQTWGGISYSLLLALEFRYRLTSEVHSVFFFTLLAPPTRATREGNEVGENWPLSMWKIDVFKNKLKRIWVDHIVINLKSIHFQNQKTWFFANCLRYNRRPYWSSEAKRGFQLFTAYSSRKHIIFSKWRKVRQLTLAYYKEDLKSMHSPSRNILF